MKMKLLTNMARLASLLQDLESDNSAWIVSLKNQLQAKFDYLLKEYKVTCNA